MYIDEDMAVSVKGVGQQLMYKDSKNISHVGSQNIFVSGDMSHVTCDISHNYVLTYSLSHKDSENVSHVGSQKIVVTCYI